MEQNNEIHDNYKSIKSDCLAPTQQLFSYITTRTSKFSMLLWLWPRPIRTLSWIFCYSANSPKQRSADRHVAPLVQINLIPS